MPYVHNPVCFICKKVHPRDTENITQLHGPDYETVNVCSHHVGIQEEKDWQENLTGEERQRFSEKVLNAPGFRFLLINEMAKIQKKEWEYLDRCVKEGKVPYEGNPFDSFEGVTLH